MGARARVCVCRTYVYARRIWLAPRTKQAEGTYIHTPALGTIKKLCGVVFLGSERGVGASYIDLFCIRMVHSFHPLGRRPRHRWRRRRRWMPISLSPPLKCIEGLPPFQYQLQFFSSSDFFLCILYSLCRIHPWLVARVSEAEASKQASPHQKNRPKTRPTDANR